ncbi:hypothetical protein ASPZODRAFT_138745 [Penicilliopsis zonata CBS 506.65]|uniref:Thiaminase-2/PQQC domain-containing protein n=1 Tax=Penicilliopsis zonata CBS 506.65 TaxID=1073090 RepID=A0A1L9SX48_9EURO|nr:hypothetical protein ASPZODRAFT_138745 [Penicilliopsis zonata CBS 506.65]OJJ51671.1 hypothetical protein ASPZODRAFT_138745 [Penicilliopsis zonata CBS 506.65]
MASQQPLTTYLRLSCPRALSQATTHPFLRLAGTGQLGKTTLSQWLSQDRLYAQSYVRFTGLLLSKIRLPTHNPDSSKPRHPTVENRAFDLLTDALVNIRRELAFFESTADGYGLDLTALPGPQLRTGRILVPSNGEQARPCSGSSAAEGGADLKAVETGCSVFFGPSHVTKAYIDLFMSAGSPAITLLEGFVVLWATEYCYLQAWKYAASFGESSVQEEGKEDADGGALRDHFIPNWSSAEFEAFVDTIGVVLDEMAAQVKGAEETERLRGKCLEWWRQVLWLEAQFWPDVDE